MVDACVQLNVLAVPDSNVMSDSTTVSKGAAHALARSSVLGNLTLVVTADKAVYMGAEWDLTNSYNLNEINWGFVMLENFFAVFLTTGSWACLCACSCERNCRKESLIQLCILSYGSRHGP